MIIAYFYVELKYSRMGLVKFVKKAFRKFEVMLAV